MIDYLNGDGGRFTLGSAVVDEVSNSESEGWKFVLCSWFMWFFNQAFVERTRRSGKDSHRDEGVEAAESGAHGLDADGGSKNDLVQEDGAERNPDVAHIVLFGIVRYSFKRFILRFGEKNQSQCICMLRWVIKQILYCYFLLHIPGG